MIMHKLTALFGLFTLFSFTLFGSSCRSDQRGSHLVIQLDAKTSRDTVAFITCIGPEGQMTDTLTHFDTKLELYLDTARFRSVLVSHDAGQRVRLFELIGAEWKEQTNFPEQKMKLPAEAPYLVGKDASGKERNLTDLYRKYPLLVVFASPEGLNTMPSHEIRELRAKAKPDSLIAVFFMPTASDSTARLRVRRDSLDGIVFSDSLGVVSEARRLFGVEGQAKSVHFRIDTLGRIK